MAKDMASRKAVCILLRDPACKANVNGIIYFDQRVRLDSRVIVKKGGGFFFLFRCRERKLEGLRSSSAR